MFLRPPQRGTDGKGHTDGPCSLFPSRIAQPHFAGLRFLLWYDTNRHGLQDLAPQSRPPLRAADLRLLREL
jgi:hypothetical protein